MLIGAHVSPAGGLPKAIERGVERGCSGDPDLQPVAAHVETDRLPRRGRRRVQRGDGREPDRRGADPCRLPAQLRQRGPGDPREVARPRSPTRCASARRSARAAWSCTPARPRPATSARRSRAPARRFARRSPESEGCELHLENTAGHRRHARALVRRARGAAGGRRRGQAAGRVPGLLPPARLRL